MGDGVRYEGGNGRTIELREGRVDGGPARFANMSHAEVLLLDICGDVDLEGLSHSRVFVGPSTGTVRIENCSDCAFTVAARRVALLSCSRCTLFLRVSEPPLVQGCLDLFLGPFNGRYRGLDAFAARAQLGDRDGLWNDPRDAASPGDAPPSEAHVSVLDAASPLVTAPAAHDGRRTRAVLTPRARSLLHAAFWAADTDRDGQLRDAEWHALAGRLSEASLLQQADSPAEACDLVGAEPGVTGGVSFETLCSIYAALGADTLSADLQALGYGDAPFPQWHVTSTLPHAAAQSTHIDSTDPDPAAAAAAAAAAREAVVDTASPVDDEGVSAWLSRVEGEASSASAQAEALPAPIVALFEQGIAAGVDSVAWLQRLDPTASGVLTASQAQQAVAGVGLGLSVVAGREQGGDDSTAASSSSSSSSPSATTQALAALGDSPPPSTRYAYAHAAGRLREALRHSGPLAAPGLEAQQLGESPAAPTAARTGRTVSHTAMRRSKSAGGGNSSGSGHAGGATPSAAHRPTHPLHRRPNPAAAAGTRRPDTAPGHASRGAPGSSRRGRGPRERARRAKEVERQFVKALRTEGKLALFTRALDLGAMEGVDGGGAQEEEEGEEDEEGGRDRWVAGMALWAALVRIGLNVQPDDAALMARRALEETCSGAAAAAVQRGQEAAREGGGGGGGGGGENVDPSQATGAAEGVGGGGADSGDAPVPEVRRWLERGRRAARIATMRLAQAHDEARRRREQLESDGSGGGEGGVASTDALPPPPVVYVGEEEEEEEEEEEKSGADGDGDEEEEGETKGGHMRVHPAPSVSSSSSVATGPIVAGVPRSVLRRYVRSLLRAVAEWRRAKRAAAAAAAAERREVAASVLAGHPAPPTYTQAEVCDVAVRDFVLVPEECVQGEALLVRRTWLRTGPARPQCRAALRDLEMALRRELGADAAVDADTLRRLRAQAGRIVAERRARDSEHAREVFATYWRHAAEERASAVRALHRQWAEQDRAQAKGRGRGGAGSRERQSEWAAARRVTPFKAWLQQRCQRIVRDEEAAREAHAQRLKRAREEKAQQQQQQQQAEQAWEAFSARPEARVAHGLRGPASAKEGDDATERRWWLQEFQRRLAAGMKAEEAVEAAASEVQRRARAEKAWRQRKAKAAKETRRQQAAQEEEKEKEKKDRRRRVNKAYRRWQRLRSRNRYKSSLLSAEVPVPEAVPVEHQVPWQGAWAEEEGEDVMQQVRALLQPQTAEDAWGAAASGRGSRGGKSGKSGKSGGKKRKGAAAAGGPPPETSLRQRRKKRGAAAGQRDTGDVRASPGAAAGEGGGGDDGLDLSAEAELEDTVLADENAPL